jgi:Leucine-rich repeat (LRR) protein
MISLEKLQIDHNKLIQLPVELGSVPSLRELTFQGNDLRTPPAEILEQGTMAISEYLKRMLTARSSMQLDLGALQLQRTPVEVAFMTGLTSLSLVNNQLHKIFVGVGQLVLLTELHLDYNELQTLPRTVCNLTNLTVLSMAHNK